MRSCYAGILAGIFYPICRCFPSKLPTWKARPYPYCGISRRLYRTWSAVILRWWKILSLCLKKMDWTRVSGTIFRGSYFFSSGVLNPSPSTSSVDTTIRKAPGSISMTRLRSWYISLRRTAQSSTRRSPPV